MQSTNHTGHRHKLLLAELQGQPDRFIEALFKDGGCQGERLEQGAIHREQVLSGAKPSDENLSVGAGRVAVNLQPIETGRDSSHPAYREVGAGEGLRASSLEAHLPLPPPLEREVPDIHVAAQGRRGGSRQKKSNRQVAAADNAHTAAGGGQGPAPGDLTLGAEAQQGHIERRPQAIGCHCHGSSACIGNQPEPQGAGRMRLDEHNGILCGKRQVHRAFPVKRRKGRQAPAALVVDADRAD